MGTHLGQLHVHTLIPEVEMMENDSSEELHARISPNS